ILMPNRNGNYVAGQQLAQVDNQDPFAAPVWRSPIHRTPEPVIWTVQLLWPGWFAGHITVPLRDRRRRWFYWRRWRASMTLAGLAPAYRGQDILPVLAAVHMSGAVDLVTVGLVTGQSPAD